MPQVISCRLFDYGIPLHVEEFPPHSPSITAYAINGSLRSNVQLWCTLDTTHQSFGSATHSLGAYFACSRMLQYTYRAVMWYMLISYRAKPYQICGHLSRVAVQTGGALISPKLASGHLLVCVCVCVVELNSLQVRAKR